MMTSLDSFQPGRDQDAWATLRGFRYQVDLSILRWLTLKPNEHLELERGEDIDHVAQALTDGSVEKTTRKLEQVKSRAKSITLRSAAALEVLANAVSHLKANAGLDLRFCYTTNASIAHERPNPFRPNMSGIGLWQELQRGEFSGDKRSDIVAKLRQFLSVAAKPKNLPDETWSTFVDFAKGAQEPAFLDLVRRFEWSCAAPDAEELTDEVRSQLRASFAVVDDPQVEELYQRLFLFILKLLTQPGIKRLTQLTLQEQLAAPTLSESDHAIVERLGKRFGSLEHRFDEVEATVADISVEVRALASQQRISGAISAVGIFSLTSPPLVDHLSPRMQTTEDVLRFFDAKQWLALYGLPDTGKTHLAGLVSRGLGQCRAWLRFGHAISSSHATMILQESMRRLGDAPIGTHIVLDDLPNVLGDDLFVEILQSLCDNCRESGVRLISTSRFRLPTRLSTSLGVERLLEIPAPTFSDAEAKDILAAHGASEQFLTDSRVRFINGLASGHPLLVTLAARFLQGKQWQLRDEEFSALIRGEHAVTMVDEVIARVCQSLDVSQRELLYRLTLAIGAIPENVALQLAAVERPIARPRECLTGLIGAWVQREPEHKLTVSPLVRSTGGRNLEATTFQACHRVLAEHVAQGPMSPWDAEIAIGHFAAAAEFDRAGTLFLLLLTRLRAWRSHRQLRSVLGYWSDLPLPLQMDLGLRINIRALQFWVFPEFGKSDDFVLRDLDELMDQVTKEQARSAHLVGLLAALFLSTRDFSRALRYLSKSIAVQRTSGVKVADFILPKGKQFVEQLWLLIVSIQTPAQILEWLDAFEAMTADERQIVVTSKDAKLGCVVLADRLMLVESHKPLDQRDWTPVLDAVVHLRKWAIRLDWAHMESCALKAEINVHGEFLKDVQVCEPNVRAFVDDALKDAVAKSLVSGMYGKMLTGANSHQRALPWLELAIGTPVAGLPHEQMMTLLAATQSCSIKDQERAIRFAEQAADIARTNRGIPAVEAAKAFGELAIAILGRTPTRESAIQAFAAWAEAGASLGTGWSECG